MALGLPVITANFPLYQAVIEPNNCGFCVDPNQPTQVAEALLYLIKYPEEAQTMGQRGRKAVEQSYNWSSEARKLLDFYSNILRKPS